MIQQRHVAWPTYLVAFSLSVIPPLDALMQVLPLRVHDPRWRFGFFGLMSNALMLPLLGLFIAFVAASLFEHRRFQRVLGIIAGVVAVIALGMLCLFALDALQVRPEVKAAAHLAFNVATLTAVMKSLLGIVTLSSFTIASLRAPKPARDKLVSKSGSYIVGNTGMVAPRGVKPSAPVSHPAVSEVVSDPE
jgi:hypothetical protein